jgi:hypothetical protein
VGETISQATSLATAVVAAVGSGYIDINTIAVGTFDASHVITGGTSTATSTPTMAALDVWTLSADAAAVTAVASNAGDLTLLQSTLLVTTGKTRYNIANHQFETLLSDSLTALHVDYAPKTSSATSAGTPAGTVATTPTYS